MAITLIASPDQHHPAYNPVHWVLDSNIKTQPGFRYVFQIFDAGTTDLLAEIKVAPRPVDGYGYCDISKILQSKVDKTDPFTTVTFISANISSIYKYDLHMGEEFEGSFQADDFFFNNLSPIPTGQNRTSIGNSGALTMPLTPYPFVAGDQVIVEYDPTWFNNPNPLVPGDPRAALIGTFNVIFAGTLNPGPPGTTPGFPYEIVLSLGWIGFGLPLPLRIRYADGRKNRVLNQIVVPNQITYNAGFSFPAFQVYDQTPYLPADPTKLFMTSIPRDCFVAYPWQEFYHQILTGPNVTFGTTINFENSDGMTFQDSISSVLPTDELQFNVSPGITWPTQIGGASGSVVNSTTDWYEYWLEDCIDDCCDITLTITPVTPPQTPVVYNLTEGGLFNRRCWFAFIISDVEYVIYYNNTIDQWVIAQGDEPGLSGSPIYVFNGISPDEPCPPDGPGWEIVPGSETAFTDPLITSNVGCTEITERLRIYINRECPINQTQLLFMDRLGSWSSYAFPLRTLESGRVERRQYRKEAGDVSVTNSKWQYNSFDKGLSNYHINHTKEYTLNTDWMPDCMSVYFQELVTSPYVYVKFDADIEQDFDPTKWYGVQIIDTQWTTTRGKNKKLIRYTIKIKTSMDNPINI
jgi:hypothetical protein